MKKWLFFAVWTLTACDSQEPQEALSPDNRRALNESILAWQKEEAQSAFAILDDAIARHDSHSTDHIEPLRQLRKQYEAQYRDHYAPARSYYYNQKGVAAAIYDEILLHYKEKNRYPEHLGELEVVRFLPEHVLQSCDYEKADLFEAGFILNCYGANLGATIHELETGHSDMWSEYESRNPPANDYYKPNP